jgi:hypothetical protein
VKHSRYFRWLSFHKELCPHFDSLLFHPISKAQIAKDVHLRYPLRYCQLLRFEVETPKVFQVVEFSRGAIPPMIMLPINPSFETHFGTLVVHVIIYA